MVGRVSWFLLRKVYPYLVVFLGASRVDTHQVHRDIYWIRHVLRKERQVYEGSLGQELLVLANVVVDRGLDIEEMNVELALRQRIAVGQCTPKVML